MTDFQETINEAVVRYDLKREIASKCQVAVSTVERWALGHTAPHPSVQLYVFDVVEKMMAEAKAKREEAHNKAIVAMRNMQ